MTVLTVDVGQKYIRYGFFDNESNLTGKGQYKNSNDSANTFYESLAKIVRESDLDITAISISFPGFIDVKHNIAIRAGSLRILDGHNIVEDLHQYINKKIEIFIENNSNCAAIAEKLNGNAQDVHDFVVMTLGNGVGGAIFINDSLLRGVGYSAGEFGMMISDYSGHGYESEHFLASAKALITAYSEMRGIPNDLVEEYQIFSELDDPQVKKIVDQWATYVAICIFNIACTLNPQKFLIGGSVSQNSELIPILNKKLAGIPNWRDFQIKIEPCRFFDDASLYGAYWAYIGRKKDVSQEFR